MILMQHHETSSGQLFNIKEIGRIAKKRNIILIVDCISSFLTDYYRMDEFGVDVTITASQKGLRLDSGMSFVILNEKAKLHSLQVKKLNYYNSFDSYLSYHNLGRGQSPFTPSVRGTYQLNERLKKINVEREIKSINKIAKTFRNDIKDLPLKIVAETPSNFLTGLLMDDKYDVNALYSFLKKKGIFICPLTNIENYLKGSKKTYFKVAHIGCDIKEHKELVKELKRFFYGRNHN
jgi:aspartate aminotransferase-like enzyme